MSQTKELQTYAIDPAAMMAYVPPLGTFVAFSIDPVATVKALKDPYATDLARLIPTSKYVGYVEEASTSLTCVVFRLISYNSDIRCHFEKSSPSPLHILHG